MLLNSLHFLLLFPIIFAVYWLIPKKMIHLRRIWLVVVSFLLYLNWNPWFSLVLLYVTLTTFYGARLISTESDQSKKKSLIWILAILAILPLVGFKYYNFINSSIAGILDEVGLNLNLPGLNWAIPIGISFFTFQALGYLFDVYRNKIVPEENLIDYLLFCSFFPQTVSGPISTYNELMPQIKNPSDFRYEDGVQGLKWLLWGVFLKCVIADRLGLYVDVVYSNYHVFSGLNCFIASIFYTIQIYADFAGYSLMAIGIASTIGYRLVNNFNRPYFAESITEFWKRWHISLTRWLTTHVYIPLGGSRCSRPKQYLNILITFIVSGMWHGANWTFVVWGGIHGMLQIVEKHLGLDPKGKFANTNWMRKVKPIRVILTFLSVSFAWIFFRMPSLQDAMTFIRRIFTDFSSQQIFYKLGLPNMVFLSIGLMILAAVEIRQEYFRNQISWLNHSAVKWCLYVPLFCLILATGVLDAETFIYANF